MIKFVPSECKGETPSFEGEICLKPLTFDEKYSLMEELEMEVDDNGQISMGKGMGRLATLRKAVKNSQKFYVNVRLKHIASGQEYSSFDDLSIDGKCHGILIEVATAIMSGFQLGND